MTSGTAAGARARARSTQRILVAAVIAVGALAGLFAVTRDGEPAADPVATTSTVTSTSTSTTPPTGPVADHAARADLAALRAEVAELQGAAAPAVAPDIARDDPPEPTDEELAARNHERTARQRDALEAALHRTGADPTWSPQAEQRVRAALGTQAPPRTAIEEVTCRATLCKVALRFESLSARDRLLGSIAGIMSGMASGFYQADPDDPRRLIVFASRTADDFPIVD